MRNRLAGDAALAVQCVCTGLVALGAAYASFRHGREFALRFGADAVTASIWPLLVDGLLTIATVELWKRRTVGRWLTWLAFVFGICLSLVANICSAPSLSVLQIIVAACPPLVLLLAVELLNGALKRRAGETCFETGLAKPETDGGSGEENETAGVVLLRSVSAASAGFDRPTAEERMWDYYVGERTRGRLPTGAELDRVAGTHNYGRRILRKWKAAGRLESKMSSASAFRLAGQKG